MKKELQRLKDRLEADIHRESFKAIFKEVPNRKMPSHDGIQEF